MRRLNSTVAALAAASLAGAALLVAGAHGRPGRAGAAETTLKRVATIDLPDRRSPLRLPDDRLRRSLPALRHLGAGLLYVINLDTNALVGAVPDVPGVEGIEYVPELKKVYTSDWWENKIGVISLPR